MLWIHGAVRRGGALIVERRATQGSIPCLSNSTAKIKHCYGVIAGALITVGISTEWRLTQALARETTAENFIRGDKTTP